MERNAHCCKLLFYIIILTMVSLFQIITRANGPMMTMDVSKDGSTKPASSGGPQECAGCCKTITERYLLKALDLFWHEDCLKCGCCDCRLGEVGSTLYTKANLILCKRDYLRLFGNTGYCAACNKVIPAFEMVMRARSNVYHLECFACQQCNHRWVIKSIFLHCVWFLLNLNIWVVEALNWTKKNIRRISRRVGHISITIQIVHQRGSKEMISQLACKMF